MKYLVKHDNEIFVISDKVVYAKPKDGVFAECTEAEATHVWDVSNDTAYMKGDVTFEGTEAEVPEDWQRGKYIYADGTFTENPDWEEPEPSVPLAEQIKNLALFVAQQQEIIEAQNKTIKAQAAELEAQAEVLDYLIMQ